MNKALSILGLFFVICIPNLNAEDIEEIVLVAKKTENRALQPTIILEKDNLEKKRFLALTDIFHGLPTVGIRTNSRGEAVLRLRGSSERQTAIYLDGAPLSIPWDGRANLGILPAGMVDRVQIIQSAAPIEFGSGAMLGAVEISTPSSCQKLICRFQSGFGNHGMQTHDVFGGANIDDFSIAFAGNYRAYDGIPIANKKTIPFAPTSGKKQKNTDLASKTFWGALGYKNEANVFKLSLLSVNSSYGIAPAGHINPTVKLPRYWRYPDWDLTQLTLNTNHSFENGFSLRTTLWHQDFSQTISQYTDINYQEIDQEEKDKDRTFGMRIVLDGNWKGIGSRVVGNMQSTLHQQMDTTFSPLVNGEKKDFQQDLYSFGWEIDKALYENINVSLGISYDQSKTPKTGGNEPQKDLSEWAGNVVMQWKIQPNFIISATVGKRTRPPTLRESYDTSLGKFLLNPMLREETATLSDITFEWFPENYPIKFSLTPWATKIDDALSRRIVIVDSLALDQRYNLKGSKGRGLDVFADWDPSEIMHFEIGASWQTFKAERNDNNEIPEILRRPKYQLSFVMDYILRNNISSRLLIQRIGKALDEDITGEIATLEASTEIDLKLFYQRDRNWTFYSEINNLTNAVVLPQLGLPSRGRMVIFGVKYSMQ